MNTYILCFAVRSFRMSAYDSIFAWGKQSVDTKVGRLCLQHLTGASVMSAKVVSYRRDRQWKQARCSQGSSIVSVLSPQYSHVPGDVVSWTNKPRVAKPRCRCLSQLRLRP